MNGLPSIVYDNRFADAAPVASTTEAGDYDVNNLTDFRPYTWWKPTALPATVRVDCGSVKTANCALVYGHDLGTQGATLEIRGSTDNWGASDVLIDSISPADDKPFLLQFSTASYQYHGLRITGTTMPSLAIVALGMLFQFPRRLTAGFDPLGSKAVGQINRSGKGHPLGSVIDYDAWDETLGWRNLSWSWVRANFKPLWQSTLRGSPFVWLWDPTDHADEIYLVNSTGEYAAPHNTGQFCDLTFDIQGVVP